MEYGLFYSLQKKTANFSINDYVEVKASSSYVSRSECQPLNYTGTPECIIQINPSVAWYTKNNNPPEAWLEFDIAKLDKYNVLPIIGYSLKMYPKCNKPTKWTLSGRNKKEENWNVISTINSLSSKATSGELVSYKTNSVTYTQYRFDILDSTNLKEKFFVGFKFFDLIVGKRRTECLQKQIKPSISVLIFGCILMK